jgi:hypothetical protein
MHKEREVHACGGSPRDRWDSQVQGIQTSHVDPCNKGSKEGMARDVVLCH